MPVVGPAKVRRAVFMCAVLCLGAVSASASAQSLRENVSRVNLRFVGIEQSAAVEELLTADDLALLVAAREPVTLNQLIAGGLPVRAGRIRQLTDWGLVRQEGAAFRSLLPVLAADTRGAFDEIIASALPAVLADADTAVRRLDERVWRHPGVPTLPALVAWILRDRAPDHLLGPAGLDFRKIVEQQRSYQPDRGFWGALWYVEAPVAPAYGFFEGRGGDYSMLIAWNWGEEANPFGQADGAARLQRFLQELEDGGRKLDHHRDFPDEAAAGLVDEDGNVLVLARSYDLRDASELGYLVEEVAVALTESVLSNVPRRRLADLLGVSEEFAMVIAYSEIAPQLVAGLTNRGLLVRANDPRAEWRDRGRDAASTLESGRPVTVILEDGNEGSIIPPMPGFAAIVWRNLIRRSTLRIAWW